MYFLIAKQKLAEGRFSCLFYFSCPAFLDISGPPIPSYQKELENYKIGPQLSRIGTRKIKETQKIAF